MQKKLAKKKVVGIHWEDIAVYYDNEILGTTPAYTEGEVVNNNKRYILVKNPETIIFPGRGKIKNHPAKKPKLYFIPKKLVRKILFYGFPQDN